MQLEVARQNSQKSKLSQKTAGARASEDHLVNSQDESMVRPERPHKRIELNESQLHQYSQ